MKNIVTVLGFLAFMSVAIEVNAVPISPIDSPEGDQFLYLTTGPGPNPVGLVGDISGNSTPDFDAALFVFEFTTTGTQDLVADINILTSEYHDEDPVPDFFGVSIDGSPVGVITPLGLTIGWFSLVEPNGFFTTVVPPILFTGPPLIGPDGSIFLSGQTGWLPIMIPASELPADTYSLVLFIADDDDPVIDTALLVDNIRLVEGETVTLLADFEDDDLFGPPGFGGVEGNAFVAADGSFGVYMPIPEPSTLALAVIGLVVGLGYARRRKV